LVLTLGCMPYICHLRCNYSKRLCKSVANVISYVIMDMSDAVMRDDIKQNPKRRKF